jgi:hypothetical protein
VEHFVFMMHSAVLVIIIQVFCVILSIVARKNLCLSILIFKYV